MRGQETVRVGEVLRLERRPVDPDPATEYVTVGVRSFGRGMFHYPPKLGDQVGSLRFFEMEADRLVISNIKAWEGAVALSGQRDAGCLASNRFLTYAPVQGRIDVNWARWFFLSEAGLRLLQSASPGSADRNRTLAIKRFEALEIPLPPIEDQRRVATRLESVAKRVGHLAAKRAQASSLAASLPFSSFNRLQESRHLRDTKLDSVLESVRLPVQIDPTADYVTYGIRSFGKGAFHYEPRAGTDIGKLRFFAIAPNLLAISNIKAWEGAVATTRTSDTQAVASNRFLFFRPLAGGAAVGFFWALLLSPAGVAALGSASPGSADRNRTLSVKRFLDLRLPIPDAEQQVIIGRQIDLLRARLAARNERAAELEKRVDVLLASALYQAFQELG